MVMAHMKANAEITRRFVGGVSNELSKDEHEKQVPAKHLGWPDEVYRCHGQKEKRIGGRAEVAKAIHWLLRQNESYRAFSAQSVV
jgi:hypothetical protein